jgi:hypothetical protein
MCPQGVNGRPSGGPIGLCASGGPLQRYSQKVMSCANLGRIEEARPRLKQLIERRPGLTTTSYKAYAATFFPPEVIAVHIEGLRRAGLLEE